MERAEHHPLLAQPDPDAYMALVEAAAPAIRTEDPTAIICGGAMSPKDMGDQLDLPFITRCVEKGLLRHVDAISWHPYNLDRPERQREQIAALRSRSTGTPPPAGTSNCSSARSATTFRTAPRVT